MTSTAAKPAHDTPITGHDPIAPRELDAATADLIEAALTHAMDSNRHRNTLLRSATDPSMAATLYLGLTAYAMHAVDHGWPAGLSTWMSGEHSLACWVRRYTIRGLIEADDDLAVHAVQTRLARLLVDFPAPATEDELTLLHHEPVALVRAAYAIARDLTA